MLIRTNSIIIRTADDTEDEPEHSGTSSVIAEDGSHDTENDMETTDTAPIIPAEGGSRITSPASSLLEVPTGPTRASVKHLTCYYWYTKGECKLSDEECRKLRCPQAHIR
jgi:hypothetical protein